MVVQWKHLKLILPVGIRFVAIPLIDGFWVVEIFAGLVVNNDPDVL